MFASLTRGRRSWLSVLFQISCILSLVAVAPSFARADESYKSLEMSVEQPKVLNKMYKADEFAENLVEKLEADGVKEMNIVHFGKEPPQLDRVVRWLKAKHIKINYQRVTEEEINQKIAETTRDKIAAYRMTYGEPKDDEKFAFKEKAKEAVSLTRHFFGVQRFFGKNGVSFFTYKGAGNNPPSKRKRITDAIAVGVRIPIVLTVLYSRVAQEMAEGKQVQWYLPAAICVGWALWFDTRPGQVNAAMGQGKAIVYHDNEIQFETKRSFFLLDQFIHSVTLRQPMGFSKHITLSGISYGVSDFFTVLGTSIFGTPARTFPNFLIERGKHNRPAWVTDVYMYGVGFFFAAIQMFDMNTKSGGDAIGDAIKTFLAVAGTTGLVTDLVINRTKIKLETLRMKNYFTEGAEEGCTTLLMPVKNPTPTGE